MQDAPRVAVVGAGIAGLTLAVKLAGTGTVCRIYERAPRLEEVGAGIQLAPNATRLLHRLGLGERLAAVAVRPAAIEMRRWDTGAVLNRTELGEQCRRMYGTPYYTVHRADLHRVLLDAVPHGTVLLNRECTAIEEEADGVRLRFADGSRAWADVVVGADGVRSFVRDLLVHDTPRYSGQVVYRGLVPAERLPHLVVEPKVGIWLGPGQHCVCYPIAAGRSISFVATTPADDWRLESWTEPGRVADLLDAYPGWDPQVRRILGAADAVSRWALHDRDPVPRWSTDRITLLGDAAHPMLPFGAQGANQAVEDAVVLGSCLGAVSPAAVPGALKRYEEARRPRTEQVHRTMRDNAKNHHFSDGPQQRDRDRAMADTWGLRGQRWLFGYDAETAVGQLTPVPGRGGTT
jgi:salicylate hydroxylase